MADGACPFTIYELRFTMWGIRAPEARDMRSESEGGRREAWVVAARKAFGDMPCHLDGFATSSIVHRP